jgi:type IV pilus assembly protein PilF
VAEGSLAAMHLKKSVVMFSSNASTQVDYGSFLCAQGLYDEAEDYFRTAIDTPLYKHPWVVMTNAGIYPHLSGRYQAEPET